MGRDFESGAWGLVRVHDEEQALLQPLPDNPVDSLDIGPADVCPAGAPLKEFEIEITDATIVYSDLVIPTANGTVVTPGSDRSLRRRLYRRGR